MKKYAHYVHQKLIPDSFLILVKQPLHSRNYFENILKEDYKKAIKKLTLFCPSNPVLFNGQDYGKQNGPGTSEQSLFRLQNKFIKLPLLVMYYLT